MNRILIYMMEAVLLMAVLYFVTTRMIIPVLQGRPLFRTRRLARIESDIENEEEAIAEQTLVLKLNERRRIAEELRKKNTEPKPTEPNQSGEKNESV